MPIFCPFGNNVLEVQPMSTETHHINRLPDVSIPEAHTNWGVQLPWVGMREIEMPVRLKMAGKEILVPARASFGMNLRRQDARGIHMSRLYRILSGKCAESVISFDMLSEMLGEALQSHEGLSDESKLSLRFDLPLSRKALISDGQGWRTYPVQLIIQAKKKQAIRYNVKTEILYSSTCPASAALSRQMNQQAALRYFTGEVIRREELEQYFNQPQSLAATPHAQRSVAKVDVELTEAVASTESNDPVSVVTDLIDLLENALCTPVQTLVKREDEQAFAVRNAENLLFCEDAARRLAKALGEAGHYQMWKGEVSHLESLHPHDAVAEFSGQIS